MAQEPTEPLTKWGYTPKTNLTMENCHFQWEIHLQIVDFPASHASFWGCKKIGCTTSCNGHFCISDPAHLKLLMPGSIVG